MNQPPILIVDDEKSVRDLLAKCLLDEGYEVEMAVDGADAMDKVLHTEFQLVITDVMMPRLDGLEFLKNVRVSRPDLPVVIITGFASTDITIRALKLGAVDFITKPFKISEIFFTVKKIIDFKQREEKTQAAFTCVSRFSRSFECTSRDLDESAVLNVLARDLAEIGFSDSAGILKISLAVGAAIENALEHGNLELPSSHKHEEYQINPQAFQRWKIQRLADPRYGERKVRIDVDCSRHQLIVRVRDEGHGFDTSVLPEHVDENSLVDTDFHGYSLMRVSMDEVTYNETGNEITLKIGRNDGDTAVRRTG